MAKGIAHRDWRISREDFQDDYGNDTGFRAAVEQEMALCVQLMERMGVAIVVAPVRRRTQSGTWFTEAYAFRTATVPAMSDPDTDPMASRLGVGEVEALEQALAATPDTGEDE